MINSKLYRGLIYAGDTPFATTIRVVQTGAMQLTVCAGTLTRADGTTCTLSADVVLDIPGAGEYEYSLGGQVIIYGFRIPEGLVDLSDLDICVLTILPGFPEGTTAADWKMQIGST